MSKHATAASSSSFRRKPELGGFALLSDPTEFQTLNGLWKGKKGPLVHAIVIRNTNFTNDGQLDLTNVAALDVEAKQLATRALQRHDIILERSGGGPKQPVGRVCLFDAIGDLPFSFSNFTSVIRIVDQRRLLPRYVHYFLLHLYKDGYTENLQHATTGIRNLNFSSYLDTAIPVISKPEQEKIAAVLWKVQRAIATQDRLIAATRELKASAMQRLFTRGLRNEPLKDTEIGPMPESWEPTAVGALGRIVTGSTPRTVKPEYYANGEFDFIAPGDISDATEIAHTAKKITEAGMQVSRPLPEGSTCVVCIGSSIGKVGITTQQHCTTNQQINAVVPSDDYEQRYVCYLLQFNSELIAGRAAPSPVPILSKSQFSSIELPATKDRDEQRAIAAALATLDRKLARHGAKRAALHDLFETLLHKLMTAEIRVNHLDIDTSEVTAC